MKNTDDLNSILIPLEGEVTLIEIYEAFREIKFYQSKRQIELNSIIRKLTKCGRELRRNTEAVHEDEKFLQDFKEKNAALHKRLQEDRKRQEEEKNKSKPVSFEINFNESKLDETANCSTMMYTTCYSFPETPAIFKKAKRRSRSLSRVIKMFKTPRRSSSVERLLIPG